MRRIAICDGELYDAAAETRLHCWRGTHSCDTSCTAFFKTYDVTRHVDIAFCGALPLYEGREATPLGVLVKAADSADAKE